MEYSFQEKIINLKLNGHELNMIVAVLSEFCKNNPDSFIEDHKLYKKLYKIADENECIHKIISPIIIGNETACSSWKDVD